MSVFDASAMLAVVSGEAGRDRACEHLESGVASIVNVAEAAGKLVQRGSAPLDAVLALAELGLPWLNPDGDQVERIAELRQVKDLSLADRFCIALAEARNEPLVTADTDWAKLPLSVSIELIR